MQLVIFGIVLMLAVSVIRAKQQSHGTVERTEVAASPAMAGLLCEQYSLCWPLFLPSQGALIGLGARFLFFVKKNCRGSSDLAMCSLSVSAVLFQTQQQGRLALGFSEHFSSIAKNFFRRGRAFSKCRNAL